MWTDTLLLIIKPTGASTDLYKPLLPLFCLHWCRHIIWWRSRASSSTGPPNRITFGVFCAVHGEWCVWLRAIGCLFIHCGHIHTTIFVIIYRNKTLNREVGEEEESGDLLVLLMMCCCCCLLHFNVLLRRLVPTQVSIGRSWVPSTRHWYQGNWANCICSGRVFDNF